LLAETHRDYGSGSHAKEWFAQECPKLRSRRDVCLWEGAQEAGDLVYVPAFFIHAIVNLEPVVAFSIQLFQPREFAWLAEHRERPMAANPPERTIDPGPMTRRFRRRG
jgi:ribosomal protein L16 Arg81 hydroxylase